MIVSALMTRKVITVQPETTLGDAVMLMLNHHVSGLPVVDKDGVLTGMMTEGDLLRRTELGTDGKPRNWLLTLLSTSSLAADFVRTHGRLVSEVMTPNPYFVALETSLNEAAAMMLKKHVKRLPVLNGKVLAGVISRFDFLRALALRLNEAPDPQAPDEAIRNYILDTLAREAWAPRSGLRVEVEGKIVSLKGVIFSDQERRAVIVAAETAPGVKRVNDELMFVDPGSGMAFSGP